MINCSEEVGPFFMGEEGRLVKGFAGEVMMGFAVVWLKRECICRGTDLVQTHPLE